MIAPDPTKTVEQRPWAGSIERKPWDYRVTAAIPVCGAPDCVEMCVKLLLAQSEPVYVMVIDTGSQPDDLARIEALRSEQVEVHLIRSHAYRHPSDPPSIAMDLAFALCRTKYLYATHSDCFIRRRDLITDMVGICRRESPIVGYELSPRKHKDWKGMVGHTCVLFDIEKLDLINVGWSIRRLCRQRGVALKPNICGPNWPDTELLLNYQAREAGITPRLIGHEQNFKRTLDENIDHFRSHTSSRLYAPWHHEKCEVWKADAMRQATERLREWGNSA